MGTVLDGRAGLHIYFLIRALQLLDKHGHLAFIMPADTCEGVFSSTLWNWITNNYRLDAVVTFAPSASPFPKVDTNPIIFMISNEPPEQEFFWAKCLQSQTEVLRNWTVSGFDDIASPAIQVHKRGLTEGLSTGLSRPPTKQGSMNVTLGDLASVMRGIATGSNDFFFLTREQARKLRIPDEFLIPAIGRTRDVPGNEITRETVTELDMKGRPSFFFSHRTIKGRISPGRSRVSRLWRRHGSSQEISHSHQAPLVQNGDSYTATHTFRISGTPQHQVHT